MKERKSIHKRLKLTPAVQGECTRQNETLVGEWLCTSRETANKKSHVHEILPYHWNDREKLKRDVDKIKTYVDLVLEILPGQINSFLGKKYQDEYFRMIICEWVYLFCQIAYDRWSTIQLANESLGDYQFSQEPKGINSIPRTTLDFQRMASNSHHWNANFFCEIKAASLKQNQQLERCLRQIETENVSEDHENTKGSTINKKIKKLVNRLQNKNPQVILTKSYLSKWNLLYIFIMIRKFKFIENENQYQSSNPPRSINFEFKLPARENDEFVSILEKIMPLYLPSLYLEEITMLELSSQKKYGEKSPRLLITANSHFGDEEWKIVAAKTKANHGKIIILQHGGNYGVVSFSLIQDYEFSICDYFLTWGWTLPNDKRAVIAPATKLIKRVRRKKSKYLLFVTGENSLYSSWLTSMPIGPQIIPTLNSSLKFLSLLSDESMSDVRIRPYHLNYGLDQKRVFSEKFGKSRVSETNISFLKELSKAKLVVCNHLSTTFIECLSNNIPTVIYINEREWETNPQYQYLFDSLISVGILHYSNEDCANFINQKYECIEDWWASDRVQDVRRLTVDKIGFTGNNPIGELCKIISSF